MRSIVNELQQVKAWGFLSLLFLTLGCEEQSDYPGIFPSEEKKVEVRFNIGIEEETDGAALTATNPAVPLNTKSTKQESFKMELVPHIRTKSNQIFPDKFYNLEIRQYQNGTGICLNPTDTVIKELAVGSDFTASLAESSDCLLVLVAWGTSATTRLGGSKLSDAQAKTISQSVIKQLDPALQNDMNKMPYYVYLPKVKITSDGRIQNPEGTDVRIKLRRLATRLHISWTYSVSDYDLSQIRLESIPTDYKIIPDPDEEGHYPSLFDGYSILSVPEDTYNSISPGKGSYSCWIPSSVRGESTGATSPIYRTKGNAPTGSVYVTFLAQSKTNTKQKLNYRLYLGSNTTTNFDLYENTNYHYTVNFNHTQLPVNDARVTIIDPVPASVNNENFVSTANCFMVAPGGSFCFNPYKYYQNGVVIENETLKSWCTTDKIRSVKVLWQTKENGDVGDPVLGVVNKNAPNTADDDHTNIVDLKNGDDFANARIYCRVAANTTGGSGVIAAYSGPNGTGVILWSWHIWVTDYNPDPTGNVSVLTPATKRKQKYTYNGSNQPPMMDRNLGAIAGFTLSDPPRNVLDMSKANGMDYQWGRKDPFVGSYSAVPISVIKGLTSTTTPPKGMLNRFGPDGITYQPLQSSASKTTLRNSCQNPNTFYILSGGAIDWCSETSVIPTLWNNPNTDSGLKTVNDPCPAGWRVVSYKHMFALFRSVPVVDDVRSNLPPNASNPSSAGIDGGLFLYYEANGSGEASYYRMTGYHRYFDEYQYVGEMANVWPREHVGTAGKPINGFSFQINSSTQAMSYFDINTGWYPQDTHTLRCIQERE